MSCCGPVDQSYLTYARLGSCLLYDKNYSSYFFAFATPWVFLVCVNLLFLARGNELLTAKDLDGALAAYTEAISLDGSDATFRSNRSAVHMSMGSHEKALVDAEVRGRALSIRVLDVALC